MPEPLLELASLDAFYGPAQVLHGVDLRLARGGITALLGANGAGKTTTLRAISRLVRSRGRLRIDGRDAGGLAPEDVVRLGVAHVPEGRGTFAALSVEDNLRLGAHLRPGRAAVADGLERVYARFPRLAERRRQQAGTLSGGEQQMLAIGRALMLRPRLLLLDEPSSGLAPKVVAAIFAILHDIHATDGVTMLLVEQNTRLALDLAHEACVLAAGRVVQAGPCAALADGHALRQAYLGP
jgi:branched-chain amino acid transport system ATP-binding protein